MQSCMSSLQINSAQADSRLSLLAASPSICTVSAHVMQSNASDDATGAFPGEQATKHASEHRPRLSGRGGTTSSICTWTACPCSAARALRALRPSLFCRMEFRSSFFWPPRLRACTSTHCSCKDQTTSIQRYWSPGWSANSAFLAASPAGLHPHPHDHVNPASLSRQSCSASSLVNARRAEMHACASRD